MSKKFDELELPLSTPGDVIVQFLPASRFLIYNTFTRSNLVCEHDLVLLCHQLTEPTRCVLKQYRQRCFSIWETEYFSNEEGLLADPTRVRRGDVEERSGQSLDFESAVQILLEKNILVENLEEYRDHFGPKATLLDAKHFGNFHQQLGYHLMMQRKEDPGAWWVGQKFTDDRSGLRDNLYKAVQGNFLQRFFSDNVQTGMRVVDIGCGTGFYANWMARQGANVVGVDPSEQYVKITRETTSEDIEYHVSPVGQEECLDFLENNSVDAVYISDSLLFYFVPLVPAEKPRIELLLREIHRVLKPAGRFWSVEPHYTFWLAPWLGDREVPFTILTEYRNRSFLVTPTMSEFVNTITSNQFALVTLKDVYAAPDVEIGDPRAVSFASEFPLWQFLEFVPI